MDGQPVRLTFSEFELLDALMADPGRLLNRQELLRAIWGDSAYRDPRAIDVHIRHLREKLEPEPEKPRYILTVRGRRLPAARSVGDVRRDRGAAPSVCAVGSSARCSLTTVATLAVAALALLGPLEQIAAQRRADDAAAATCRARADAQRASTGSST